MVRSVWSKSRFTNRSIFCLICLLKIRHFFKNRSISYRKQGLKLIVNRLRKHGLRSVRQQHYGLKYLKDPAAANYKERFSIQLLAHEGMHVRGERNEQHAECQAIQRSYRTALMMGVPEKYAVQHSINYFLNEYPRHP